MKEREGSRKYRLELGGAMVLYLAVLFVALSVGKSMEAGLLRTLVVCAPVVPVLLAVWVIARHFKRMDEFVRLRSLESLAVAAAITAGLSLTYGFLESAGYPKLSMFWVWPVMGAVWGLHSAVRCKFSQ
jgi:hypothetical protein